MLVNALYVVSWAEPTKPVTWRCEAHGGLGTYRLARHMYGESMRQVYFVIGESKEHSFVVRGAVQARIGGCLIYPALLLCSQAISPA